MDTSLEPAFVFRVEKSGNDAILIMDCGEDLIRARRLLPMNLSSLAKVCERVRYGENLDPIGTSAIPTFAEVRGFLRGTMEKLSNSSGAQPRTGGIFEYMISLYDEGDDSLPVLMLIEEQIYECSRKTKEAGSGRSPKINDLR
jgi:hypothetical protein